MAEVDVDRTGALRAQNSQILIAVSIEIAHDHGGWLKRRCGVNRGAVGKRSVTLAQQDEYRTAVGRNGIVETTIAIEVADRRSNRAPGIAVVEIGEGIGLIGGELRRGRVAERRCAQGGARSCIRKCNSTGGYHRAKRGYSSGQRVRGRRTGNRQ